MKKKILFIMNNLTCGGAEKSLVNLLSCLDYGRYNVDLYLFESMGTFMNMIHPSVNILSSSEELQILHSDFLSSILNFIKKGRMDLVVARLWQTWIHKKRISQVQKEQKLWKHIHRIFRPLDKEYDIVVGYLEKNPIYFAVDKVKAKKKIGWIHTDYKILEVDPIIEKKYFKHLDVIVGVSESCAESLKVLFPEFTHKINVIRNIVYPELIRQMALTPCKTELDKNSTIIVTVARLHYAKGIDLAIHACKMLIDNGFSIKWYVIGEGTERVMLEQKIHDFDLSNSFILLGEQANPYPYIKNADIYVQPSRYEGYCITIAEAKILCKPIVSTNFPAVYSMITDGFNGLIVNSNAQGLYYGLSKLLDDQNLQYSFYNYLITEKFDNINEIDKINKILS